ncbi:glycosyltransferase family 2 protein [Methylobacter sp. BBA5.1]|uniref:glycosyltransferase family 2 protein n=1 Tax=Methylobacter sp. BBA5.1 TaxID=1495064 RepID=UPI0005668CF4|nr:glycosyltransferase [Methylobacter sp. BBA5.1]
MDKANLGIVIIGRNEGERLLRCIKSATRETGIVVYVDSGSTDNSIELARQLGAEVVDLDLSVPFTAARARNAGFEFLNTQYPSLNYVQFIDGDCELVEGWVQRGLDFLNTSPQFAIVCGRRRERYPKASIYNQLCDLEWDTPVGETRFCGGDALMRVDALKAVSGFNGSLIAGEEPELCIRLRQAGWKIYRLDAEMTLHDAAMTRFNQWWRRTQRGGYAFAEGVFMHGGSQECHRVKESRSVWLWGCLIPVVAGSVAFFKGMMGWGVLLVYPLQVGRLALRSRCMPPNNWLQAFFLVLGKFPEFLGQLQFLWNRLIGSKGQLIEYK